MVMTIVKNEEEGYQDKLCSRKKRTRTIPFLAERLLERQRVVQQRAQNKIKYISQAK